MASDLKERAKEAFVDDNFELAVQLYTLALDMDPRNADLLADRAQANIKLKSFTGSDLSVLPARLYYFLFFASGSGVIILFKVLFLLTSIGVYSISLLRSCSSFVDSRMSLDVRFH